MSHMGGGDKLVFTEYLLLIDTNTRIIPDSLLTANKKRIETFY